jgi:hypothetical protein
MIANRVTDIIGKPVHHESGERIGVAHDVRAIQTAEFGQPRALRVTGIVTGKGSLGVRLGYGDQAQQGPALLRLLLGRRARHARYVPWEHLRVESDRIIVTTPTAALAHPDEIDGER